MTDADKIAGPAGTLDLAELNAWLNAPVGQNADDGTPFSRAYDMLLDEVDTTSTTEFVSALDEIFQTLLDHPHICSRAPEVDAIDIRRNYDGDGCDGVYTVVDLNNGLRLMSLHQDHRTLTGGARDPVDAMVHALTTIMREANTMVGKFQEVTGCRVETYSGRHVDWVPTAEVRVGDRLACLLSDAHAFPAVTGWTDRVLDLAPHSLPSVTHRTFQVSGDTPWWVDESMCTNNLANQTLIVAR
jgi:hypothetical protein